ncbi:TRAF3-interacting protein 1 [Toxorhynchites rutilus septentrionalis]|uniref:TRAF3-interacting protein 1 n=1 Tax=Toxorhynchites rutilus septentrionalis TaxID=329112 RepID=UPI0024790216|nr:TRAF3-interacting protein 1 [Toxorhynchites rutilus septentrionalis]
MTDPDSAVIKKTQSSLGKYVKKPALTEKLLKKPPFRFLHDVINVVIKDTGFLKGLYTPEELVSDNIKDREAKIAYLQKLIDVTKIVTGKELKVRPSKVVAGLEPEKTNELLQAIGHALDKKLDSSSAVSIINEKASDGAEKKDDNASELKKKEEKKNEAKNKDKKKEKTKEKTKEKDRDKEKDKIKRNAGAEEAKKIESSSKNEKQEKQAKVSEKEKEKTNNANKTEKLKTSDKKKLEKTKPKDKEKHAKRNDAIKEEPTDVTVKPHINGTVQSSLDTDSKESDNLDVNGKPSAEEELIVTIEEDAEVRRIERSSSRKSSLKKQGSLTTSENNALADLNQFNGLEIQGLSRQNSGIMVEPLVRHDSDPVEPIASERISAKPPINRQQSVDSVMRPRTSLRPPSVRPPSARPGAPRRKDKNVEIVLQPNETTKLGEINVKMEVFNNDLLDDDGENLIVIEDPSQPEEVYSESGTKLGDVQEGQEQGHLVQQILETQKEFSNIPGGDVNAEVAKKSDIEWTSNQRQSSARQMEAMRESIQKLTRSVNPLGKLMDFLQEDIDSMERELGSWQQLYGNGMVDLNKERSMNENAIEPLKHQLAQIETNIKEYSEMIDITRASILQNEQKIERLYMTEI